MAALFRGRDDLLARVGEDLGVTDWEPVRPEDIASFASATRAFEAIHFDSPQAPRIFDTPVAHGYLVLSLATHFLSELVDIHGLVGINYGLDRVRFPAAVPVGSRVRATGTLMAAEHFRDGAKMTVELTFECDATEKPPCVATVLSLLLPDDAQAEQRP
jgi:acyl dehydratase